MKLKEALELAGKYGVQLSLGDRVVIGNLKNGLYLKTNEAIFNYSPTPEDLESDEWETDLEDVLKKALMDSLLTENSMIAEQREYGGALGFTLNGTNEFSLIEMTLEGVLKKVKATVARYKEIYAEAGVEFPKDLASSKSLKDMAPHLREVGLA